MSKLSRREFKELISVWNKQLINESQNISLKEIKSKIKLNRTLQEKEVNSLFARLESKWGKLFSKYGKLIVGDLENSEEPVGHILDAIESFSIYYNSVQEEIKQKIAEGTMTSSELRGFVESKKEAKKSETRTANRIKCRNKANLTIGTRWSENSESSSRDFEVIYVGNDWTVVYPKTLLGSISWAVGLADGSEEVYEVDENGTQIGRVTWCTASYENNRFPMYAGNLHMYYFIKNKDYNIDSKDRRLCISLSKKDESEIYEDEELVEIDYDGGATVNAKNEGEGVSSLEEIKATVNNDMIIDLIKSHASTKKVTSVEEMSSKVTLSVLKQDEVNLSEDKENLNNQIGLYLKYAKDESVISYIINNYSDTEVYLDLIYDDGPLPLLVFERKDIIKRIKEDDLINELINLYEGTEKAGRVFYVAIESALDGQENFITIDLKDKMINCLLTNPNIDHQYIEELLLASSLRKIIYLSDIVKILNFIIKKLPDDLHEVRSLIRVILQEFYFESYKDHKDYKKVIKLMKAIYSKTDDRLKNTMLADHDYVFESVDLKKYIKLVLS